MSWFNENVTRRLRSAENAVSNRVIRPAGNWAARHVSGNLRSSENYVRVRDEYYKARLGERERIEKGEKAIAEAGG